MAELVQTVYANSLFDVALAHHVQDKVNDELIFLQTVLNENPEYKKMLSTPVISRDIKCSMLTNAFEKKISEFTLNLLKVLVDNNRFNLINEIVYEYQQIYNNYCGIMVVTAVTATVLNDQLKTKLINKLTKVTGKKVQLVSVVDKSIIGGIKLKYNNTEIDSTIKSKLNQLKQNIKKTTI